MTGLKAGGPLFTAMRMDPIKSRGGSIPPGAHGDARERFYPILILLSDLALLGWWVLVGGAFLLLASYPPVPTRREVPGIAELEGLAPGLLFSILVAAIIRYFCLRTLDAQAEPQGPLPQVEGQFNP